MSADYSVRPFSGSRYGDNAAHSPTGTRPCVICGRPVFETPDTPYLRVVAGGGRFAPADTPDTGMGEMGFYPIGTDCLRKLPPEVAALVSYPWRDQHPLRYRSFFSRARD